MTYATLQTLIDRYGERMLIDLTDRGEIASGTIDQDVVDRALADTDAMIDGYLSVRYKLPMSSVPAQVVDIASQIAIYKLHRKATDEKIKDDYKDAVRSLRDMADGKQRLEVEGIEPAGTGASGVKITDRERPFTPENLKGWV